MTRKTALDEDLDETLPFDEEVILEEDEWDKLDGFDDESFDEDPYED